MDELIRLISEAHKQQLNYDMNKAFDGKETPALDREIKSINFFCGKDSMGHSLAMEGLMQEMDQ